MNMEEVDELPEIQATRLHGQVVSTIRSLGWWVPRLRAVGLVPDLADDIEAVIERCEALHDEAIKLEF